MILQDEFEKCGYRNILVGDKASDCKISLDDIFDVNHKPAELLGIYISKQRDELFFILNGDAKNINDLCDCWDDRIRVFTIINNKVEAIQKLKYNIIQLIVCSCDSPDKKIEGNLLISRKIIIQGNLSDKKHIVINDDDSIELPFYMIPPDAYAPDEDKQKRLRQLVPQDGELSTLLKKSMTRKNERLKNGVTVKSLSIKDYECIKEWLDDDNT